MKIRKATVKDLDSIMELVKLGTDFHCEIDNYYKPFSKYKGLEKYYKEQLKDKKVKIIIAEDKTKEIVGFLMGVMASPPYLNSKKIGIIDSIFIKENYRRKGTGNKLFKELIKWFKEKNIKYIEASVDARNKIGVNAWKKFGFFDYRLRLRMDL